MYATLSSPRNDPGGDYRDLVDFRTVELLTVPEVCTRLNLPEWTIRRAIDRLGLGRRIPVGRSPVRVILGRDLPAIEAHCRGELGDRKADPRTLARLDAVRRGDKPGAVVEPGTARQRAAHKEPLAGHYSGEGQVIRFRRATVEASGTTLTAEDRSR